jgi:hypothetical protein
MAARLASCSRPTRELVAGAAVLGQRFSVTALREVTGLETTGAAIVAPIDAGLLTEVPGTGGRELAFAQVLTREVVYQDLGRGIRTQLHQRCARTVAVSQGTRGRPRQVERRPVRSSYGTKPCNDAQHRQGARMKWLMWALVAVAIAIGLALLAGQSDLRRFQRMRRM